MLTFLASALAISLSGVISPGPMTATVIARSGRQPEAGALMAVGHALVEVPLVIALYLGAVRLFQYPAVAAVVGIVGGMYLLAMGNALVLTKAAPDETAGASDAGSSVMAGVMLSAGNPYFFIWWATIGPGLVLGAREYGFSGLMIFLAAHWLCDLGWYGAMSIAAHKGIRMFGCGFYRAACVACGLAVIYFGGMFIAKGIGLAG